MTDSKLCPFCAEEIKFAAIVCKHCKRDLPSKSNRIETIPDTNIVNKELPKIEKSTGNNLSISKIDEDRKDNNSYLGNDVKWKDKTPEEKQAQRDDLSRVIAKNNENKPPKSIGYFGWKLIWLAIFLLIGLLNELSK